MTVTVTETVTVSRDCDRDCSILGAILYFFMQFQPVYSAHGDPCVGDCVMGFAPRLTKRLCRSSAAN